MNIPCKPLFIGLAGGSASGKSTIARRLAEMLSDLRVELVGMDRYFRAIRPRMVGPVSGEVYEDHNHPDSFDMDRLLGDLDTICQRADPPQVVIIEGLMTLHSAPIRNRLDLGVFVDVRAEERIVRRLKRNMAWGQDFDAIATFVLESVRYRHDEFVEPSRWQADIVLNGTHTSERGVNMLVEWIRAHAPASHQPSVINRPQAAG